MHYSFFHEDSRKVTISIDEMGIRSINRNNIYLDNTNFVKIVLKLLFMLESWFGIINLKTAKDFKKK